ncbi:MAG: peptidoglycan editing factor PgeF [Acidobacteriaceae bacterium]|nr:peptidoglycan editing factor PgeF [Acidobacteriaceae bacterium]MBV9500688.1 peptidoglycan editing factor PgeF [Acidobacteriaceae bacterium]
MSDSFRLGNDGIYRCDALQQFLWQKHGFGTRQGNPKAQITLRQIHSDRILNANVIRDRDHQGDALITDCIDRSIGVRTADCVPVLLLDSQNRAIGAVHAGWRGSAAAIIRRTIEKLTEDFGSKPPDIYAALGPCIRACCYVVDATVAQQFAMTFPEWELPLTGKQNLDLPEANRRHMVEAGVKLDQIFDCDLCTACQSASFYSFRREPENPGRMVAAIERLG